MCIRFMLKYGIRNIYYSNNDGNIVVKKVKEMNKSYLTGTTTKILNIMPIGTMSFLKS